MNDSGAFGSSNMVRGIGMLGARFYVNRAFLFLEAFSYSQHESFRERGFKDYGARAGMGRRLALDLD